jgi:transcriptional regulator with XRE-family HTH domain
MGSELREVGALIRERRLELGLTQARLARLAGVSRVTVNQLESGSIDELGFNRLAEITSLLGLRLGAGSQSHGHLGLEAASRTASVGYRDTLDPDCLASALASGKLPPGWIAHVSTLLDEAPLSLIVAAVEEAAAASGVQPRQIWRNVERWAVELASPRRAWA